MGLEIGVLFALAALLFWGFGDFLIQKSTRKFGDWETLFVITLFGTLILTPFVYTDLAYLFSLQDETFFILTGVSVVLLVAALLDFEALKKGKLAIVEPVYALEVPIAIILAFTIINETINPIEIILISVIVIGLVLVSMKKFHFSKKGWIERGVILAALGSIFMGASNFLYGFASRITNPLLTNWFVDIFVAGICLFYLFSNKKLGKMSMDFSQNKKIILSVSALDNLAWIAFAISASLIPIAIAVGISESYIALSAVLGMIVNRERLLKHQKLGITIALLSAFILTVMII